MTNCNVELNDDILYNFVSTSLTVGLENTLFNLINLMFVRGEENNFGFVFDTVSPLQFRSNTAYYLKGKGFQSH